MRLVRLKNRFAKRLLPCTRPLSPCAHRGQALVEFAVVSLVIYMLLAAILTFGHALYVAQGLQSAVDLAAREISRTPLPADITLDNPADDPEPGALHHDDVRNRIFDEAFLVIDLNAFYASDPNANFFQDAVPQMPLLNQQLAMLMIVDRPDADTWLLRYPGALLSRGTAIAPPAEATYPNWVATGYTVGIPLVTSRSGDGVETIRWVPVMEEIDSDDSPNPFQITSSQRGLVALRINFPFQSASMSSFRHDTTAEDYPFEPTIGRPNVVDDGAVDPGTLPEGTSLTDAPLSDGVTYAGTYGGKYGLGAQGALGSENLTGGRPVRPYRRVISAQAIYRREVFE